MSNILTGLGFFGLSLACLYIFKIWPFTPATPGLRPYQKRTKGAADRTTDGKPDFGRR